VALVVYGGLVALTAWSFNKVPTGFVPTQDKQYLVAFAQLPDASSLDRTEAVIRRMSDIGLKQPGVESAVAFPGLSISGFSVSPNEGIVFFCLKPFEERTTPQLSGPAIAAALNQQFAVIQDAFILTVPPPPVNGLGTIGGFKLYVEDRADLGYDASTRTSRASSARAIRLRPGQRVFHLHGQRAPIGCGHRPHQSQAGRRAAAKSFRDDADLSWVALCQRLQSLRPHLSSRGPGRRAFRERPEDITRLKTRNDKGQMVPLGALVKVTETHGPNRALRYNGYPAAEINGGPAPVTVPARRRR
jgi:multidrug efflux pump